MVVYRVQIWYNLQDTDMAIHKVTVCKIWVWMQLARVWYIVLTYMTCGCMTIRMRMHEQQEKRERN